MDFGRLNETIVMGGEKGTGKTSVAQKLLSVNNKNYIVVDLQDHPAYRYLPTIEINDIKRRPEFDCRIITRKPYDAIAEINEHIYNMNIVLEDARRYIRPNMALVAEEFVINHKQHNMDLIIMYHSLKQVPPFLVDLLDKVVVFKTKDKFKAIASKFCEELAVKHKAVMASDNPFEFDYIDL